MIIVANQQDNQQVYKAKESIKISHLISYKLREIKSIQI